MTDVLMTPEHDKLNALSGENQIVGNFIEWLGENQFTICEWSNSGHEFYPSFETVPSLLAKYFGIDLEKLEKEKRAILERFRTQDNTVS